MIYCRIGTVLSGKASDILNAQSQRNTKSSKESGAVIRVINEVHLKELDLLEFPSLPCMQSAAGHSDIRSQYIPMKTVFLVTSYFFNFLFKKYTYIVLRAKSTSLIMQNGSP